MDGKMQKCFLLVIARPQAVAIHGLWIAALRSQ